MPHAPTELVDNKAFKRSALYPKHRRIRFFGVWSGLVFLVIGYAILNRGFAYIGFYPFFVGEIALGFYLLTISHSRVFPRFFKTRLGFVWGVFFVFNFVLFLVAASSNFSEALRNSIYWVYTIFLYFGFTFGRYLKNNKLSGRFEKVIFAITLLSISYYLIFPFRIEMQQASTFLSGGGVSLFGYYSSLHALAIGFVFFAMFGKSWYSFLVLALGLLAIIMVSQSRASFVALAVIIVYILIFEKKKKPLKIFGGFLLLALLVIPIALSINFEVVGQRGGVNADFMNTMVSSIFSSSGLDSLDGTRADRLSWWLDVIQRTVASSDTLLFGLGVDTVLVDRATGFNTIIRYPHNSFVSVFGFSGVIGFVFYCLILGIPFVACVKNRTRYPNHNLIAWYPIFFLGYIVSAFFSTVFEAPFHSAVFWTITGITYSVLIEIKPINHKQGSP